MKWGRFMKRRTFVLAAASAALVRPGPAGAQGSSIVPIVGFIALASRDNAQIEALELGFRENGLVQGTSFRLVARFGNGDPERSRRDIAELIRQGTIVFITGGPNIARLIQSQSQNAAIVVASMESLEAAGFTGTIPRPQGNVTGFATLAAELLAKRLALLSEIVPGLNRVVMIGHPQNSNHAPMMAAFRAAAARLSIEPMVVEMVKIDDVGQLLGQAKASGARAVLFIRDYLFESNREKLAAAVQGAGLPSSFDEAAFVHLGGLMCYGPNRPDLFRRAAGYGVKILAGAKPTDLPIQQPTKFELVINLKAASALGLTVPTSLLARADEVIE